MKESPIPFQQHFLQEGNIFPIMSGSRNWKDHYNEWLESDESSPFAIKEYDIKLIPGERRKLVDKWKYCSAEKVSYDPGEYRDSKGIHKYRGGIRLYVGKENYEVMDSCQRPWCEETVNGLFRGFEDSLSPLAEQKPTVLLRGFGLGEQARLILNELIVRKAGELHIIELNKKIVNTYVRDFFRECIRVMYSDSRYNLEQKIKVYLHYGDAFQITEQMAKEEKKFDVIISDTYPLSKTERSVNDVIDIDNQIRCLKPKGRFSFFSYSKNYKPNETGITDLQQAIVTPRFDSINIKPHLARIDNPSKGIGIPPDYKFLQTDNGPVEYLPVVICAGRRLRK